MGKLNRVTERIAQSTESSMNVLFAASEAVPFAKTGGLADVIGALSSILIRKGVSTTVFLPLYGSIDRKRYQIKSTGRDFFITISGKQVKGMLYACEQAGVPYYFIKQDHYFARSSFYQGDSGDYPDNAERFIFFSRAVLEGAKMLGLQPDVIHCHDWHTALIPLYLKTRYARDFPNTASLFTIHNLGYQGLFWHYDWHLLNLPWKFFHHEALEFYGKINFLKGGLVFADLLSTVSPRYAKEIQTAAFGYHLEGVLKSRKKDLVGILNGLDTDAWNPEKDPYIPARYNLSDLSGKEVCKAALQKEVGLPVQKEIPLLAIITRLAEQKGIDLLASAFERLMKKPVQIVMLGSGEEKYERIFQSLAKKYPDKVGVQIGFDSALAHRIEAGADIFLMPSQYEPCGLNQMMSLRYGTVPLVRSTGGLDDTVIPFNAKTGLGNGFKFRKYTPAAFLRQVEKSVSLFQQKKSWRILMENGMRGDYSWEGPAEAYLKLYRRLKKKGRLKK